MDFEYLGPYKLDGILGKGGMGTVYKGHHAKTGDVVAVKVIADSIANQERFRRRFDAEIESLERLTNRHIVKLIGYGEEHGRLFYSMEYIDGETLYDKLKREKKLHWEAVLKYGLQICFALKHAHDIGVIHRDLKPSNLLIDKSDNVKIMDFGIAKLYGGSEETMMGAVLGTADFMPPEQAEGTRVTVRSDLYALGAVLYTCLSGRSPHFAKTTPETLYNVRYKIPASLREQNEHVPRELDILILELLEKDPKKRPPTALVVWNRMAAMQAGLSRVPESLDSPDISIDSGEMDDPQRSIDLRDVDINLANEVRSQRDDQYARGQVTRDAASRDGTKEPGMTLASDDLIEASHMGRTTNVATHLTQLPGDVSAEHSSVGARFTTVDENQPVRRRRVFEDSEDAEWTWSNVLSTIILVVAVIACIGGIYYATRRPSADSLYQATLAAAERSSSLDTVGGALDTFRTSYPNDPRLKEFSEIESEIEVQRMIIRLSRRVRKSGDTAVSPLESALVSALREQNPSHQIQQLRDIMIVFQDRALLSPDEKKLIDYAARELEKLTEAIPGTERGEEEMLNKQLDSAKGITDVEKRRVFYDSFIRLYSDKAFAKDSVVRAQHLLDELTNAPSN